MSKEGISETIRKHNAYSKWLYDKGRDTMKSHWYTGEVVKMCEHGSINVYTDGDKRYAYCPNCKKTWVLK